MIGPSRPTASTAVGKASVVGGDLSRVSPERAGREVRSGLFTRLGIGCAGLVLIGGLAFLLFGQTALKRLVDHAFAKTRVMVVEALPAGERHDATARCDSFWTEVQAGRISESAAGRLQEYVRGMLEDNSVSEPEARGFLGLVSELREQMRVPAGSSPNPP
jgi:hypothetical protein